MKVKELIKILSEFDQEEIVVVDGYEGEADDIGYIKEKEVILNENLDCWYYGKHTFVDDETGTKVIILSRMIE